MTDTNDAVLTIVDNYIEQAQRDGNHDRVHQATGIRKDIAALSTPTQTADAVEARAALANIANTINVVGSPLHKAQEALDELVSDIKRQARNALKTKDALSHTNTSEGVEARPTYFKCTKGAEFFTAGAAYEVHSYDNDGDALLASDHESRCIKMSESGAEFAAHEPWLKSSPPTPDTTHNAELVEDLEQEADLCRNEGVDDIAVLLDKAVAALRTPDSDLLREAKDCAYQAISDVRFPPIGDSADRRIERYQKIANRIDARLSPAQKGGA